MAGLRIALFALMCAGAFATPGHAQSQGETPRVTVRLIPEHAAIAPGETLTVALRQTIIPGWHTYWKNPGDAGEPTHITWDLPYGFVAGDLQWPAPKRIDLGPLTNYGFENEVVLLADIAAPAGLIVGTQVTLAAHVTWQVCKDICIPEEMRLTLDLPVRSDAGDADPLWANVFVKARQDLPRILPAGASFVQDGAQLKLILNDDAIASTMRKVELYPTERGLIVNSAPQMWGAGSSGHVLRLDAGKRFTGPGAQPPARFDAVIVAEDRTGQRSSFAVMAARGGASAPFDVISPLAAFALAVLGGLLLNLMPCVFPVLSMKIVALARMGGQDARAARRDGALYGLGVVSGFLAVGGLLIALRYTGAQIGWGFQLQSPAFVTFMTLVFFAIGLDLLGVFELRLPRMAGPAHWGKDAGALFTGLLAVLVASPCTVPFMATAVGAAALLGPAPALLIFAGLGIGMAAPFVALGLAPRLLARLPRPGPWMVRLKQIMAFAMFASAAWLLWVLSAQTGREGLASALAAALTLGFALWALGEFQRGAGAWSRWSWPGALVLSGVCVALVSFAAPPAAPGDAGVLHESYSAARLNALRAAHRPVFVEVTADWCITCKVNERLVLDTTPFELAMKAHDVVYLRADWTRRSGAITQLLAEYERNGVPLYLFFAPGAGEAYIFPQVLTLDAVLGILSTRAATLAASGQVP